jgi:hypothetical protein
LGLDTEDGGASPEIIYSLYIVQKAKLGQGYARYVGYAPECFIPAFGLAAQSAFG